jgi:hypothetical protein
LEVEGRLLKPSLKADTQVEGRFGFRGDISYDDPETILKDVRFPAFGIPEFRTTFS